MSYLNVRNTSTNNVLGFTYPKLHQGKSWYIDFYAFDPADGKMKRKKYMLDGIVKVTERRKRAAEMMQAIMKQLRGGWNPWVNSSESRGYTLFDDCLDNYLRYVGKMDRKKTIHSYTSRVNILKSYIKTQLIPIKYVYQFDEAFVNDFLDWILLDRDSSPTTRNNYRGWCYSLAEYLIGRKYITSNPVEGIKPLKEDAKARKDLTPVQLKQMAKYLKKEDPYFLLACYMEYFTFIRPTELTYVKVGDISVEKQTVFVSGMFSKNHKDANVGLNETLIKLMVELNIFAAPSSHYLFGKDFKPNSERLGPDRFNKRWVKMREALNWKDCYQFYSLKDSGIRDLANAEGAVVARDQARHSDISTTNRYIQGANMRVHEATKTFRGSFEDDEKKEE